MSRLRAVIARRMVESLQVTAQLTTVVEVDVTRIAKLRQQAKEDFEAREGVKLSFLPFFAKAAVEALKAHPSVNSSIDQEAGTVTYHDTENLGIAVDTERGLLVPVIHDAGDLNLGGIARKIADLAERTRTNKITPDELGGGTFTLTNTGSRGALFDTPIINQPQVGDPRHRLGGQAAGGRQGPRARRGHRGPVDGLPGPDLRPPHRRRRRRGPVPHHGAGAARGRPVRGRARPRLSLRRRGPGSRRGPDRVLHPSASDCGRTIVKIAVTGASGLIGSALVAAPCAPTGTRCSGWYGAPRARPTSTAGTPSTAGSTRPLLADVDAVVNLAGAPIRAAAVDARLQAAAASPAAWTAPTTISEALAAAAAADPAGRGCCCPRPPSATTATPATEP